jgi:hypothetical protein
MDPSAYAHHFGDIVSTESDVESMQFCMDFIKRYFKLEKANELNELNDVLIAIQCEFTAHFSSSSTGIFAEDISTILFNKLSESEHRPDDILYHPRIMNVMVEVMWWRHFRSEHGDKGNEGSLANAKIQKILGHLNRTNLSIYEGVPPSIEVD